MAATIKVDIVSAEKSLYSGEAEMLFAPATMGEIGIAPRHTPLITNLVAGELRIKHIDGPDESMFITGGILEVQPHLVTVLSDVAKREQEMDEVAAQEAKERAEKAMQDSSDKIDYARAQAEFIRAIAELRTIEKLKNRKQH
ncbi:MAG: F0F1 ATP synthase subunit epsilon [Gammaproteobacteria bacterium]|nr:F0F1 ATP synthase subunit epsilon [Gammaproteobacteria bacterium]